ncbi:MAG: hypothetical protein ACKO63_12010 [Nodosilinea sp.]
MYPSLRQPQGQAQGTRECCPGRTLNPIRLTIPTPPRSLLSTDTLT